MNVESQLCTSCGLCCTGALHDGAKLEPDEVEPAIAVGLPVLEGTAPTLFALPCPKLEGATCTIYGSRPRVCAAYACRLLEEVRGGRHLDSALPLVAEARRLAGELQAALAPGATFPDSRTERRAGSGSAEVLMRSFALDHYLDRHFRNRSEGPILSSESAS
ncbi:Fe-S-cluster containining protein [Sphingomonas kaistensis]|uniref:Fe-S-cluster containining protein n=1 Tax=Sphingomonas kaistensis TaxID=298708 RepID=A0A7X5Y6Q4_9SPHN|nr:YkgJ family cysteine cluster protein [Sphingomonas kaistensis]NJC06121.1 Fe-S-cluster containining protein [Sphingomonas kaistensis]